MNVKVVNFDEVPSAIISTAACGHFVDTIFKFPNSFPKFFHKVRNIFCCPKISVNKPILSNRRNINFECCTDIFFRFCRNNAIMIVDNFFNYSQADTGSLMFRVGV